MAQKILENEYFRLTLDDPEGIVRYTRSAVAYPSGKAAAAALHEILGTTRRLSRHLYSLLTDVRAAPGRNDSEFEQALGELRHQLFDGFKKQATLVRTAVGRLQVERLARERRTDSAHVFESEEEALAYLLAPSEPVARSSERPAARYR